MNRLSSNPLLTYKATENLEDICQLTTSLSIPLTLLSQGSPKPSINHLGHFYSGGGFIGSKSLAFSSVSISPLNFKYNMF